MNHRAHVKFERRWLTLLLAAVSTGVFADVDRHVDRQEADVDLQEVVVTAQRRSENLQTVPIAITAGAAAGMERNGIHELGRLSQQGSRLALSPLAPGPD